MSSHIPDTHFMYEEWLVSKDYPELAAQMILTPRERRMIAIQAYSILEPVRDHLTVHRNLDCRIVIPSGKRSPELNSLTPGASEASQHLLAEATDWCVVVRGKTRGPSVDWNRIAFFMLANERRETLGQIILYVTSRKWGRFIHTSLPSEQHHGEVKVSCNGKLYDNAYEFFA